MKIDEKKLLILDITPIILNYSIKSLKDNTHRELFRHQFDACFNASGKLYSAHELEFTLLNEFLDFVFVAMFFTIAKQKCSHGGDEVPTSLQTAVDVIHGRRGHVVWHEDATGGAAVVLTFEFGGEDIKTIAKEEGIAFFVQSFSLGMLNEFLRCISSIDVFIPLLLEQHSYHSSSTASIEDPSFFW